MFLRKKPSMTNRCLKLICKPACMISHLIQADKLEPWPLFMCKSVATYKNVVAHSSREARAKCHEIDFSQATAQLIYAKLRCYGSFLNGSRLSQCSRRPFCMQKFIRSSMCVIVVFFIIISNIHWNRLWAVSLYILIYIYILEYEAQQQVFLLQTTHFTYFDISKVFKTYLCPSSYPLHWIG